jgi:hypothetical protein
MSRCYCFPVMSCGGGDISKPRRNRTAAKNARGRRNCALYSICARNCSAYQRGTGDCRGGGGRVTVPAEGSTRIRTPSEKRRRKSEQRRIVTCPVRASFILPRSKRKKLTTFKLNPFRYGEDVKHKDKNCFSSRNIFKWISKYCGHFMYIHRSICNLKKYNKLDWSLKKSNLSNLSDAYEACEHPPLASSKIFIRIKVIQKCATVSVIDHVIVK